MIQLKIGDVVEIEGKEFEVWCLTTQQYADRTQGTLELADPLWATRQREGVRQKREEVGQYQAMVGEVVKFLKEGG